MHAKTRSVIPVLASVHDLFDFFVIIAIICIKFNNVWNSINLDGCSAFLLLQLIQIIVFIVSIQIIVYIVIIGIM